MNPRHTRFLCRAVASLMASALVNAQPALPAVNKVKIDRLLGASNSLKRDIELGKKLQSDDPRLTAIQLQLDALQKGAVGSDGRPINPSKIFPNVGAGLEGDKSIQKGVDIEAERKRKRDMMSTNSANDEKLDKDKKERDRAKELEEKIAEAYRAGKFKEGVTMEKEYEELMAPSPKESPTPKEK